MAKILLIDDIAGIRRSLSTFLMSNGHVVIEASNGRQGIQLLLQDNYDLVITDILMPEQDGSDVILFLDKIANRPPVLAMSGGGMQMPANLTLTVAKLKADSILIKPFENKILKDEVDRLLEIGSQRSSDNEEKVA